jgi:tetratricopeptide (TPR) repeat protein
VRAYSLKVAVLRHLNRDGEARDVLVKAMEKTDPLDLGLIAEKWLLARDKACARELFGTLNEFPAAAQEVAAEFMDAGLWDDGREVLMQTVDAASDKSKISPLVYYYLGHFAERLGDAAKAARFRLAAAQQPPDYAFPFQWEMVPVLRRAMEANPQDARAPYYLGNLLFDWQPDEAVALWEKSVALAPNFSIPWRNLAQAFAHKSDDASRAKAIGYLEKAIALPDALPTQFAELDALYAAAGAPVEKRLTLLKRNQKLVLQKDEGRARLIGLEVSSGELDQAIALLQGRTFNVWEGATAYNTGELWAQAHIARGLKHFAAKDYHDALADFAIASKFPGNLRANEQGTASHKAEVSYWSGCAHEALREMTQAREAWSQAATNSAVERRGPGRRGGNPLAIRSQTYFQALALRKLGENDRAEAALRDLLASGEGALASTDESAEKQSGDGLSPRVRSATANYLAGLGHAGLGEMEKARANFDAALTALPDHFGAKIALEQLSKL